MDSDANTLTLFTAHRGALVSHARRILGDPAHAEDVVQEAYLRFSTAIAQRTVAEPLSYLYRIVHNLALDGQRRASRDRARLVPETEAPERSLAEEGVSPEARAMAAEELQIMADALDELPQRTRLVLEMHRLQGLTLRDIAGRLGISLGLAHSLAVDGLEHCRRRLHRPHPGARR